MKARKKEILAVILAALSLFAAYQLGVHREKAWFQANTICGGE